FHNHYHYRQNAPKRASLLAPALAVKALLFQQITLERFAPLLSSSTCHANCLLMSGKPRDPPPECNPLVARAATEAAAEEVLQIWQLRPPIVRGTVGTEALDYRVKRPSPLART